jgi:hypothetical protein
MRNRVRELRRVFGIKLTGALHNAKSCNTVRDTLRDKLSVLDPVIFSRHGQREIVIYQVIQAISEGLPSYREIQLVPTSTDSSVVANSTLLPLTCSSTTWYINAHLADLNMDATSADMQDWFFFKVLHASTLLGQDPALFQPILANPGPWLYFEFLMIQSLI